MAQKHPRAPMQTIKAPLCATCGHTVKRHQSWGHNHLYTTWHAGKCTMCEMKGGYVVKGYDEQGHRTKTFVAEPCPKYKFDAAAHLKNKNRK